MILGDSGNFITAQEVQNIDDCETHFITDRNEKQISDRAQAGETIKMCGICIKSYMDFVDKVLRELGE